MDATGAPIAGPVELKIKFFDAATGGTQLGPGVDDQNVVLTNGVFQAPIVLDGASFQQVFGGGGQVFIQVTDASHSQTYPAQAFSAVPYALRVPVDATTITYDANGNLTLSNPPPPVGTAAGDLVQVETGGKLPALDGSEVVNLSAANVTGLGPLAILPESGNAGTFLRGDGAWASIGLTASGGNLGIGTTAPAAALDVEGTLKFGGGSPAVGKVLMSDASGDATWQTVSGTTQWQTVGSNISFSSGSVGIGTTSPVAPLDLNGTGQLWIRQGPGGPLPASAGSGLKIEANTNGGSLQAYNYATASPNNLALQVSGGNVGIGVATPIHPLEIHASGTSTTLGLLDSNLRLETGTATINAGAELSFAGFGGTEAQNVYATVSAPVTLNTSGAAGYLAFSTKATTVAGVAERMRIDQNGNVGIGTTSPQRALDVVGSINASTSLCIAGTCQTSWPTSTPISNYGNAALDNVSSLSIGTTTTGTGLLFGSSSTPTIGVQSASTAGANLTVQAGGTSGSNLDGGNLVLASGSANGAGSSQIQLQTYNGTSAISALTVLGNGNVGIGTTSPNAALQVGGSDSQAAIGGLPLGPGMSYATSYLGLNASFDGTSFNSGHDAFNNGGGVIFGNIFGDVSIGNIPTAGTPTNKTTAYSIPASLIVYQNGSVRVGPETTPGIPDPVPLDITKSVTAAGGVAEGAAFQQTLSASNSGDALTALYINPTFSDSGKSSVSHNGLIVGAGNVGIGTTSPEANLQIGINGAASSPAFIYLGEASTSQGNALLKGNWASPDQWGIGPATGGSDNVLRIGHVMPFSSNAWNATQDLNLEVGGNISIGTTVHTNTLDVNGATAIGQYAGAAGPSNGLIVSGNVGIGTTAPGAALDVNGHIAASATGTPALSTCGTSPSIIGNDTRGQVVIGGGATGCTLTFATAYSSAPYCIVTGTSTTITVAVSSVSTTQLVIGSSAAAPTVYYQCLQ